MTDAKALRRAIAGVWTGSCLIGVACASGVGNAPGPAATALAASNRKGIVPDGASVPRALAPCAAGSWGPTADGGCQAPLAEKSTGAALQVHRPDRASGGESKPAVIAGPRVAAPTRKPGGVEGGLSRGNGDAWDAALLAGDRAYAREDWATARKEYARARAQKLTDPAPRVGLLRVRIAEANLSLDYASSPKDNRVKGLVRELDEILRLDSEFAPAHLERGRLLLILGDAESALGSLRRAAELDASDAESQSALGVAWLATGQSQAALECFRQATALDPDNPERLANLGTAYLMRGLVGDAIRAYARAVALAPGDARAQGDLGTAYLAANQPKDALNHLRRAVELAPERATFRSNLGYAYQLTGDLDGAVQEYRTALDKDANLGSAWINLGTALAKQGKLKEARAALVRALSLDPSDPRAKANLEELAELEQQRGAAPAAPRKGPAEP